MKEKELKKMLEAGLNFSQIAKIKNCYINSVIHYIKKYGLYDKEKLDEMYYNKDFLPLDKMANYLGIKAYVLESLLKEHRIKYDKKFGFIYVNFKESEKLKQIIIDRSVKWQKKNAEKNAKCIVE